MNANVMFQAALEVMKAIEAKLTIIEQRLDAIETAIGELQGTREITDIHLTDELITMEVEYSQEINAGEVFEPYPTEDSIYYSYAGEMRDWERFNTRFENLPEQGGRYD